MNFNKISVNSNFAMSMLNENTWNPIKTLNDFDTYADNYADCYYGRSYFNLSQNDCTENKTDCNIGDYYWKDCIAYEYIDGINDIQIDLNINEQGIPISDIPNPQEFEDIYHYNLHKVSYNHIEKPTDKKFIIYLEKHYYD